MKTRNLLSLLAIIIAVAFISTDLLGQSGSTNQSKTKNEIKTQTQDQNKFQGETQNQVKNQNRLKTGEIIHGKNFVDNNGDGFNDNAPDIDGDGIPNGQDPDFIRPQDGTGLKKMNGKAKQNKFGGNKYGPGDGTGNSGIGPHDGSGYGPGGSTGGSGTGSGSGNGSKRGGRK